MEPEVKQGTSSPDYVEKVEVNITPETTGRLAPFSPSSGSDEQWKQILDRVSEFLADLPEYLSEFFGEYKRPIISVSLVIGAIIGVKLTLAILGAINDIPLLSPLFELVGMGYSAWFIYRYLLRASDRKDLASDFNALKEQILGDKVEG